MYLWCFNIIYPSPPHEINRSHTQNQKPYLNLTDLTLHPFLFRNSSYPLNHPSLFVSHFLSLLRIPCKLHPTRFPNGPTTSYSLHLSEHNSISSSTPIPTISLISPPPSFSQSSHTFSIILQFILIECCDNTNKT